MVGDVSCYPSMALQVHSELINTSVWHHTPQGWRAGEDGPLGADLRCCPDQWRSSVGKALGQIFKKWAAWVWHSGQPYMAFDGGWSSTSKYSKKGTAAYGLLPPCPSAGQHSTMHPVASAPGDHGPLGAGLRWCPEWWHGSVGKASCQSLKNGSMGVAFRPALHGMRWRVVQNNDI